jgi:hypothetical protein
MIDIVRLLRTDTVELSSGRMGSQVCRADTTSVCLPQERRNWTARTVYCLVNRCGTLPSRPRVIELPCPANLEVLPP